MSPLQGLPSAFYLALHQEALPSICPFTRVPLVMSLPSLLHSLLHFAFCHVT